METITSRRAQMNESDAVEGGGMPKILDMLEGAYRSEGDPDLPLARMLAKLLTSTDEEVRAALAQLVEDANTD